MQEKRINETDKSFQELHAEITMEFPKVHQMVVEAEPRIKIALLCAEIRKSAGLTQRDVARLAHWDKAFVSRLESASGAMPDIQTLQRFVKVCGANAAIVITTPGADGTVDTIHSVALTAPGMDEREKQSAYALEGLTGMSIDLQTHSVHPATLAAKSA